MPQTSPQSLIAAVALGTPLTPNAASWVQHYSQAARRPPVQAAMRAHLGAAPGAPSASSWLSARRPPDAVARAGAPGPTTRDQTGTYYYANASDLQSAESVMVAQAAAINGAVAQCNNLSNATAALWTSTYASWQSLDAQVQDNIASTLGIGAADLMNQMVAMKATFDEVQDQVAAACPGSIPPAHTTGSAVATAVIVVAIAAAVIAGLWFLSPLILAMARPRGPAALPPRGGTL